MFPVPGRLELIACRILFDIAAAIENPGDGDLDFFASATIVARRSKLDSQGLMTKVVAAGTDDVERGERHAGSFDPFDSRRRRSQDQPRRLCSG